MSLMDEQTQCQCLEMDQNPVLGPFSSTLTRAKCGLNIHSTYSGIDSSQAIFENSYFPTNARTCEDLAFKSVVPITSASYLNLSNHNTLVDLSYTSISITYRHLFLGVL